MKFLNRESPTSRLAIFGSADGLTLFLGLVLGLVVSSQTSSAIWHAALGGASGELVGMSAGQWLSDRSSGIWVALACGIAAAAACILPAWPFLVFPADQARIAALGIAVIIAGVIAWARPEHGWVAIADTYGILIGAGLLSGLTALI